MGVSVERILGLSLLREADPERIGRFVSEHQMFVRKYPKGATVHRQGDACETLDVVLSGSLAAYSLSDNGSAVSMFEFREGGMIGANLLFGESGAYPLNIYSVAACELMHIRRDAVEELLHGHDFVMRYIRSLSQNSLGMNRKITMLTQKTLRENILDYLRQQAILQGTSALRLPVTKKELADHMGVQRPSLFRALKKLSDEGVLRIENRTIRLMR